MITFTPNPDNPCADNPDCIIGTATAILVAAAATAGASATTAAYSAHTQGSAAKEGLAAQTAASNAALEYEKEQDRLERERQTRLDAQKLENDKFERDRLERRTRLEGNRYGDYTNNIAPYLATGASANERMASILGLPAPAPYVPRPTQGPGGGVPFVDPEGPATTRPSDPGKPLPPGTGPLVSTTMPVPATPGPERLVTLRAPNGQTKQVRESDVAHYESLGATRVA